MCPPSLGQPQAGPRVRQIQPMGTFIVATTGGKKVKSTLLLLLSGALLALAADHAAAQSAPASATVSDNSVKIGVMTDTSGLYSDIGGQGSVEAARMAVQDFGGQVL